MNRSGVAGAVLQTPLTPNQSINIIPKCNLENIHCSTILGAQDIGCVRPRHPHCLFYLPSLPSSFWFFVQFQIVLLFNFQITMFSNDFLQFLLFLFLRIFRTHTLQNCKGSRELKCWEKVHLPLCVMFHMPHVTYHKSWVAYHVSLFFSSFFFKQSGDTSWWRVCYQQGYPV